MYKDAAFQWVAFCDYILLLCPSPAIGKKHCSKATGKGLKKYV